MGHTVPASDGGAAQQPLVLYHDGCWDGFCAAWVAGTVLRTMEAVPVQYGTEPPDVTGRRVYILDFSYPRPVMRDILGKAAAVVVLDHHKTAREELAGIEADAPDPARAWIRFDMTKSGARLAWEYFVGDATPAPGLVDYVEDRDLWQWALPGSKAVNANLRSYPFDFQLMGEWAKLSAVELCASFREPGEAILRRERQIVDEHIRHAREVVMDGHAVLAVNATVLYSEIAGELARGRPFGACWFERSDGKQVWSLRSNAKGVDVSAIAKAHGGGGHEHAAGFEQVARPQ